VSVVHNDNATSAGLGGSNVGTVDDFDGSTANDSEGRSRPRSVPERRGGCMWVG
jgi:hypothetical protein